MAAYGFVTAVMAPTLPSILPEILLLVSTPSIDTSGMVGLQGIQNLQAVG